MLQLQDYINQVRVLINDTNSANFTDATLINFINQGRVRVAMDTHCLRGFLSVTGGSALNTIGGQENYNYNGSVAGVTVTNGGTGYTSPTISFTNAVGDTTGSGATASAVVLNGIITNINMTNWGTNYTLAPTVNITGTHTVAATATSTVLANIFDIISMTTIWGQSRIMHYWLPFSEFQTWYRQLTFNESVPGAYTLHQGIGQAFLFPIPDQAYTMEWDILQTPTALTSNAQFDTQILPPFTDPVQFFVAHLCAASLKNFQTADYWYSGKKQQPGKYDSRIMQLAATTFCRRVYNPYRAYLKRLRRM